MSTLQHRVGAVLALTLISGGAYLGYCYLGELPAWLRLCCSVGLAVVTVNTLVETGLEIIREQHLARLNGTKGPSCISRVWVLVAILCGIVPGTLWMLAWIVGWPEKHLEIVCNCQLGALILPLLGALVLALIKAVAGFLHHCSRRVRQSQRLMF